MVTQVAIMWISPYVSHRGYGDPGGYDVNITAYVSHSGYGDPGGYDVNINAYVSQGGMVSLVAMGM